MTTEQLTKARERIESALYQMGRTNHGRTAMGDALQFAVEAIDRLIPNKPIIKTHINKAQFEVSQPYCPVCAKWIGWKPKYCLECGQSIDWSEDECMK